MRRQDREITDRGQMDAIIRESHVCHLGLSDQGRPYIVPLNFGYDGEYLYFHVANKGRKLDIIRANNRACFEFDVLVRLVTDDVACKWTSEYRSVMGAGTVEIITDEDGKRHGLEQLMAQYSRADFTFNGGELRSVIILKLHIDEISGKESVVPPKLCPPSL
jgi:uncharacterized protein